MSVIDPENFGRLAVCSQGRLGIITGEDMLPWGRSYVGRGIDGTAWASRNPRIITEKDTEIVNRWKYYADLTY